MALTIYLTREPNAPFFSESFEKNALYNLRGPTHHQIYVFRWGKIKSCKALHLLWFILCRTPTRIWFYRSKNNRELILNSIDKYWEARKYIKKSFEESGGCYGYRRVYFDVKEFYKTISEKVIRRIMKEDRLVVKGVTRKKFNSYKSEINVTNINLIERNFKAERPNEKWLTDVTEFTIPAGKIYLSPIIDCFDGLPVSWSISTTPNTEMVCSMLDNAISTLKPGKYPILHSDRGISYQWPSWLERINKAAIKRSMSKKTSAPPLDY